eukprot:COSAG02_NODE_11686_length_1673_cov_5.239517_1_plen_161_part_00
MHTPVLDGGFSKLLHSSSLRRAPVNKPARHAGQKGPPAIVVVALPPFSIVFATCLLWPTGWLAVLRLIRPPCVDRAHYEWPDAETSAVTAVVGQVCACLPSSIADAYTARIGAASSTPGSGTSWVRHYIGEEGLSRLGRDVPLTADQLKGNGIEVSGAKL